MARLLLAPGAVGPEDHQLRAVALRIPDSGRGDVGSAQVQEREGGQFFQVLQARAALIVVLSGLRARLAEMPGGRF